MNINIIFTFLAIGLFLIFYLFEPMDIEPNSLKKSEVALLDLNDFTIYEYSERGLTVVSSPSGAPVDIAPVAAQ